MAANANFDALLSTTLANYRSQLTDNVFTARPLTYTLMDKGRIRMLNGGTKIVEPLIYGKNSTVASYSGYDSLSLAPQEGISAAEYEWKQYAASIAISGIEEAKNNGEQEIINLLEAKIMQAEESMRESFNQMFFADGTGNSGKDWNGLGNLVGKDHPDTLLTTQTLFEKYEALLQPNLRYTDTKTADAGFQNLLFKAAPVMYDVHCTAGVFYFLNSKYITLVGHSDKWFSQTAFMSPEDTDARYALIMCYGNLTVRNRAKQGKLTAKTA